MGHTVADVVDALESGDDLFVMGDGDNAGFLFGRELAQECYSHAGVAAPAGPCRLGENHSLRTRRPK